MSNDRMTVELEPRELVGKAARSLKNSGIVPAVLHNHGKASTHVQGNVVMLTKVYGSAGKHQPVEVKIAGKQHLALIKDVDFHPTKHQIRHIVFQSIRQNETTEAEIPVMFSVDVEIPAEKKSLLILKQLDHVQVKALPNDLPDAMYVDPSVLDEVGDSVSVADLIVQKGVTVLTEPETQIAIVEMPKDQIAEADASAASLAEDADKPDAADVPAVEQDADEVAANEADK